MRAALTVAGGLLLLLAIVAGGMCQAAAATMTAPSTVALQDIPQDYLAVVMRASRETEVPWQVLAAVLKVECDFGRNCGTSTAGAQGPCQFLPSTWAAYGADGDGDGVADPWDYRDCIPAMARYLRSLGAPGDLRGALGGYGGDPSYADRVMFWAVAYGYRGEAVEATPVAGLLTWPLTGTITSLYGQVDEVRGGSPHSGIDIAAPEGTPVAAAGDGVVGYVCQGYCGGYGNMVIVSHGLGVSTVYAHLSRLDVAPGTPVARGTVLGAVGSTGLSTGPHLHLEVRVGGLPVDPLPWLMG